MIPNIGSPLILWAFKEIKMVAFAIILVTLLFALLSLCPLLISHDSPGIMHKK
jgi:hypothetical protein